MLRHSSSPNSAEPQQCRRRLSTCARDVELDLKIELGRTYVSRRHSQAQQRCGRSAFDRLAGDPVDIFVNGRLIARGEVLILNDNFCVRIAELVAGEQAVA